MSMINKVRLEEFANGLWAKIKLQVGESITNITYDQANKKFVITKSNGTTVDLDVKELIGVEDVTFDNATNIITISKGNGTSSQIDLSSLKDNISHLLKDAAYDEASKTLTFTKEDNTTVDVDLTSLATIWENLDHTSEITFRNLVSGMTPVVGHYETNGNLNPHNNYRSYLLQCTPGKTYMRTNSTTFQNKVCNLRGGTDGADFIQNIEWTKCTDPLNGRECWSVTIPNDTNITHFTLSYNNGAGQGNEIMVWERGVKPPQAYVQDAAKAGILIEEYVHMQFDPTGTNLNSTTITGAIRELDVNTAQSGKVQSVNNKQPDTQGNIQLTNTDVGAYGYNNTQIDDANAFTETGYARTHNTTANLPKQIGATWGVIQCLKENNNQLMQFWYQFDGLYPGRIYRRFKVAIAGGNWSDWERTTTANDLNAYLPKSDVDNTANKVPRLDAQGKLVTSILPKITINETMAVTATDQTDLETKTMALTVENGDMIVAKVGTAPNVETRQYICIDATKTTFAEKFVELSFPSNAVTEGELQTELAKYVLISDTGTGANQVLRLDAQGKIDDANLKLATSQEINDIINALN